MLRWGLIGLTVLLSTAPAWAATSLRSVTGTRAPLGTGCPAAAMVVVYPKQMPLFLSPPHGKALLQTTTGFRASVGRVDVAKCSGNLLLRSVSLFGSITAQEVRVVGTTPSIVGLQVGATSAVGSHFPLGWGRLDVGDTTTNYVAALTLTLSRDHDGLPAGTRILVGVSPVPPKPKVVHHKHNKKRLEATHEPLTVTPRLGVKKLAFPLVGSWGVYDSYGVGRSDVPGGWHHGDDLFAPLGTPVVAVADGTVNRVGWEKLGGWRLWVRDTAGDQFYYAHLSGYAPGVLHSKNVRRGEVIGFVGNTGDAFTTQPHLHFEVHPRKLLHLAYDGAVDPTKYLEAWPHVYSVAVPHPVHPQLPRAPELRTEANEVWRELLVARHLVPKWKPGPPLDAGAVASASLPIRAKAASSAFPVVVVALVIVAALGAAGAIAYRRRQA